MEGIKTAATTAGYTRFLINVYTMIMPPELVGEWLKWPAGCMARLSRLTNGSSK